MYEPCPLSREELGFVISAYTGVCCCRFDRYHAWCERLLGRPILTHEFGEGEVSKALKEKARPQFLELAKWSIGI